MAVLHDAEGVAGQRYAARRAVAREGGRSRARRHGVRRALGGPFADGAGGTFRERDTGDARGGAAGARAHLAIRDGRAVFRQVGRNRFDDPRKRRRYGTSYFGFDLHCAFAETVLHDEVADLVLGGFPLVTTELDRHVLSFDGAPLTVAVLHGLPLKNLGGDGALSTIAPYDISAATVACRPPTSPPGRRLSMHVPASQYVGGTRALRSCRTQTLAQERRSVSAPPPRRSRIAGLQRVAALSRVEPHRARHAHAAAPLPATRACRWYSIIDSATPAAAATAANRNTCG
ncbi:RES domain-containing protein [Burkholderia semiarida]|uniref:RES domain-containing protein n=1 Tax=Burkholderia semiarida TaxID=2843303 RepID=A0ABW7L8E5_9BURK